MFEIVTANNSQHLTLNDNAGVFAPESMIVANGPKAIGWAVLAYAARHGIEPARVGYASRPAKPEEV